MGLIKYGLRHKESKVILSVTTFEYQLYDDWEVKAYELAIDYGIWLVDTKKEAEYVKNNKVKRQESEYYRPINPYKSEELEVVKVDINIEVVE
jgi:hypothetical protein